MSDDASSDGDDLSPAISELLARASTWDDPPADLEARVVTAVATQQLGSPVSLDAARERRAAPAIPRWLSVAAAVAVVVAGAVVIAKAMTADTPELASPTEIELDGTELVPGATARATLESTPAGLKILLDSNGLPGAAPGSMYEAWVSDGQIGVSAGTFHMRGGDATIELWAGVIDPAFHILTVTIEPVDGVAGSSGQVVLRGEYELTLD